MSPPKKTNAKNNTLGISDVVLTTLNDAAISAPVPYIQQAAGLALKILSIVQGAKNNTDAFQKLAADTCELEYVVLCMYDSEAMKRGGDDGSLDVNLQSLLGKMSAIERFSRKEVSRGALPRFLRKKKNLGEIQDFRGSLQLSLGMFRLQQSVNTSTSRHP